MSAYTAYLSATEIVRRPSGGGLAIVLGAKVEVRAGSAGEAVETLRSLHAEGEIDIAWETPDGDHFHAIPTPDDDEIGMTSPCLDAVEGPEGFFPIDEWLD